MKIKNVFFTGFAAAMFAGVCGAADAAAVSLISKDYADNRLQEKLVAGDGIAIAEDGKTISADGLAKQADLESVEGRVDTAEVNITTLQGDVATKADANSVYTKGDVDSLLDDKADKSLVGTLPAGTDATTVVEYVTKRTEGIATDAALGQLQATVDSTVTAVETLNDAATVQGSVAYKIAESLKSYRTSADQDVIDAQTLQDAKDYADGLNTAMDTRMGAVESTANAAATKTYVNDELAKKADVSNVYTKGEVDATVDTLATKSQVAADIKAVTDVMATDEEVAGAIEALDLGTTYAAKSYEARVEANETAIATNKTATETNATAIATNKAATEKNAGDIKTLQEAGYVVGTKSSGSYLVNFDANGVASYASIEVLDSNGDPIDLTTGAVK